MLNLNEIERLYLTRQSCRSFNKEREIEPELLERVLRLALLAPSACNAQPWKLYAVTGQRKSAVAKALQDMGMNKFVSDAPALVVIAEGKSNVTAKMGAKIKDNDFTHNDIGILTAHLVLAAEAAGLNSCILGWRNKKKLCEALDLPKDTRIPEVVALGYATDGYEVRPKKRKDGDTLFFLN